MDVLWRRHPLSADDVIRELATVARWRATTVKTLLARLSAKGAIASVRDGRRYLYHPLLKREDYLFGASKGLLDRLFGGRIAPLVAQFSQRQPLNRDDLAELERLIERLRHDA